MTLKRWLSLSFVSRLRQVLGIILLVGILFFGYAVVYQQPTCPPTELREAAEEIEERTPLFSVDSDTIKYPPMIARDETNLTNIPLILYWTPFFGGDYGYLKDTAYSKMHCGDSVICEVTTDRSRFRDSSALLIHPRDEMVPIPLTRKPWQRLVFYYHEPPQPFLNFHKSVDPSAFNLTMTYRTDSDIYMPYGFFIRYRAFPLKVAINYATGKTKLVMWTVSNCNAASRRANYVNHLRKYIPVDVYGRCGTQQCTRTGQTSCWTISKKYKFYLAFESSYSMDYITEKVYDRMMNGLVPVVMGAVDYSKFLPEGSYIDIADFASPRALAEYLLQVNADDKLYSSYFEWRNTYQLSMSRAPAFCHLCAILSSPQQQYKMYANIRSWWFNGTNVGPDKVYPNLTQYFQEDRGTQQ